MPSDMCQVTKKRRFSNGQEWLGPKSTGEIAADSSTTYKNVADVQKCFKQKKLATFTPPELDENTMNTQR